MGQTRQALPATVPDRAKQAGDIRARWAWVEAAVWTDRMLTALEQGVKGGVWFSLIDKVHNPCNVWSAWCKAAANDGAAGVDHVTVKMFERDAENNVEHLARELKDGRYHPQAIRRHYIPKPGGGELRPLGIPTLRDRIAQGAVRQVLEPIFEKDFHPHSYGFRPGKGCKDALRRVRELLDAGYRHVVDADLKGYFDSIPHSKLMERVGRKVADGRVLKLVQGFLTQGVMEGTEQWTPTAGAPQGAVLSPLLSNVYLDPLDHQMSRNGYEMVRYADDFVILCRNRQEAERALEEIKRWTAQAGLTLHPEKTRIVDERQEGFEFLGYRFGQGRQVPRDKSRQKFKDAIRGKTKRTSGDSLNDIIQNVNRTMRGWYTYFKHSHRWTFGPLDGWVRMRLRSILRRRAGKRGVGRGVDHQRWPNRYFADLGLFSLATAHRWECQSMRMANH